MGSGDVTTRGVITPGQNSATHVGAARHAVNPSDRVAIALVAFGHGRHDGVEVSEAVGVDQYLVGFDLQHLDGDRRHHAREPHAAHRGPKEFGVGGRRDRERSTGRHETKFEHVTRERTIDVVILAVHVSRHGTAHRHLTRTGSDGHKPPLRNRARE